MGDGLATRTWRRAVALTTGGSGPTVVLAERISRTDRIGGSKTFTDQHRRTSTLGGSKTFPSRRTRATQVASATGTASVLEQERRADQLRATHTFPAVPRSGTPDSDAWGDAWVDAGAGQTGVNHGADAALDCSNLVTGQRRGLVEIDLTRFTGALTASGNAHSLSLTASNANVAAATLTVAFAAQAGRPFTESTLTNANAPALATLFSLTASLPAGSTNAAYSLTLSDAQLQQLLGKWVQLTVTTATGTLLTVSVASREASAALRPSLTFTVTR